MYYYHVLISNVIYRLKKASSLSSKRKSWKCNAVVWHCHFALLEVFPVLLPSDQKPVTPLLITIHFSITPLHPSSPCTNSKLCSAQGSWTSTLLAVKMLQNAATALQHSILGSPGVLLHSDGNARWVAVAATSISHLLQQLLLTTGKKINLQLIPLEKRRSQHTGMALLLSVVLYYRFTTISAALFGCLTSVEGRNVIGQRKPAFYP